jgi:hypothetical protein
MPITYQIRNEGKLKIEIMWNEIRCENGQIQMEKCEKLIIYE